MSPSSKLSAAIRTVIFPITSSTVFFLVSNQAFAFEYALTPQIELAVSDNALRDDDNKVSERQDRYGARIMLQQESELYSVDLDYDYTQYNFEKESQENENMTEGNASLRLGKSQGVAALYVDHSVRRTLIDQQGLDDLNNSDNRSISSVRPEFRIKLSEADSVLLSANTGQITYEEQDYRSTSREGGTASWYRATSKVSSLSASYTKTHIVFDNPLASEYDYDSAYLTYSASLRNIKYAIKLGYNATDQNGETFEAPSYDFSVDYANSAHNFSLMLSNYITDTSAGDNNQSDYNREGLENPDSSIPVVDQYKIISGEISYQNNTLCGKCSFSTSIGRSKDEYKLFEVQDQVDSFAQLRFQYSLSIRTSVAISSSYMDTDFSNQQENSFSYQRTDLRYSTTYRNGFGFTLFGGQEKREANTETNSYVEGLYGLTAQYAFQ